MLGAEDDVGVGFGEAEEVAVEEELVELGEREGAGPGVEGLELDAAEAAGLPVGVVGEDAKLNALLLKVLPIIIITD